MGTTIEKIVLQNFRRFQFYTVLPNPDVNVLIGDNEAGKSSILEAIDLVASGNMRRVESIGIDKLLNAEVVQKFGEGERTIDNLPIMRIELFLDGQFDHTMNGKNNTGFNVGLSAKIDLPTSLFIMPELYYTTFKNELTDPVTNTTIEAKSNRVDLPVLVGLNVLGDQLGVFVGPVASYNLSTDNQYNDFKENAESNFTVGYQFGAQVKVSKLLINARYEGAFNKDQREFINNNVAGENYTVRYDNRPSLFMVGLGYAF